MQVEFLEVGRDKRTWAEEMVIVTPEAMERSVRNNAALLSRSIDFAFAPDDSGGDIFVGGFRKVGSFRIT